MSGERRTERPQQTTGHGPMGGPGRGAFGLVEKPKNFGGTLKSLAGYLKPFRAAIIGVFLLAILSNVFAIVGPRLLGRITNRVVSDYVSMKTYDQLVASLPSGAMIPAGMTGGQLLDRLPAAVSDKIPTLARTAIAELDLSHRPTIDFGAIGRMVSLLLALYVVSALFNYAQNWIMSGVSQAVTYRFRKDIADKINRLPFRYFDTRTYGEVLSRITNDVDTVSQTLNQSLTQMVSAVTTIVGILIMMLSISWQMTLVALLIVPLSFLVVGLIIGRSQGYFKSQQAVLGTLNGHIEEMYSGHVVMRVFGGAARSVEQFHDQCHLVRQRLESPVLVRAHVPDHEFPWEPGIRRRLGAWRVPGGERTAPDRGYPGVHPVHELVQPADHPDCEHRERAPVHRCRCRTRLRVPG